jgi:hypothetical protein
MSNLLPTNWWETSGVFGSLTLPYGFSAPIDAHANKRWDSLDGNLQLFLPTEELLSGERKAYWKRKRLDWELYVKKLVHKDCFHIRYSMPLEDFEALVDLLGDGVVPNVVMSKRRCGEPIYPKMVVPIGIRVLAGGNHGNLMNTFGISKAGFDWTRNKFINAVLTCTCKSLDIRLPNTPAKWEETQKGSALNSANQVLKECVGAL